MAPDTALDRVERILHVLPLAARDDDGVAYDDLAARLGVSRRRLERDLAQVSEREFYHPAGEGDDIQVGLDAERVRVWTTGHLKRPPRLTPGEAAALDLGLRILAAEREDGQVPERLRSLLERVARVVPTELPDRIVADGDPDAADAIRALLVDAARRRRRVAIAYLKPDALAPEQRDVEPYAVVHARGKWYCLGNAPEKDDVRAFRVDRILQATLGDAAFDPPADFDPGAWLDGGRVYRADEEVEVTVRYSPRVAPWLLERGEGEAQADGGVLVRHTVADPRWVVRHVLGYGPEAEVVAPEEAREWVVRAVEGVL